MVNCVFSIYMQQQVADCFMKGGIGVFKLKCWRRVTLKHNFVNFDMVQAKIRTQKKEDKTVNKVLTKTRTNKTKK